jgi:hypothetical protein
MDVIRREPELSVPWPEGRGTPRNGREPPAPQAASEDYRFICVTLPFFVYLSVFVFIFVQFFFCRIGRDPENLTQPVPVSFGMVRISARNR